MGETTTWFSSSSSPSSFAWSNMVGMFIRSDDFWRENVRGGWATVIILVVILAWKSVKALVDHKFRSVSSISTTTATTRTTADTVGGSVSEDSGSRISDIITDVELRTLINNLEGKFDEDEKWDDVVDRRNNLMAYNVKSCKTKNGPLKYLSSTVFEGCSAEVLRDFYMDNDYRKKWDSTFVDHQKLQIDEISGTEIGRAIKKFPFLTPREYILAWRVWEGKEKTYYCISKECEHASAPRQNKYVRVGYFRSGWRVRKLPDRDACEIKMVHQEDAGLNAEMAKLAFSRGIWSYVCKMDAALRKYTPSNQSPSTSRPTAVTLMQKVPPELDSGYNTTPDAIEESASINTLKRQTTEVRCKKLCKIPSNKTIANGLLILGGVLCLSRGHSSLGAKVAIACILKKLTSNGVASVQVGKSR